jgi:hypothetical protein
MSMTTQELQRWARRLLTVAGVGTGLTVGTHAGLSAGERAGYCATDCPGGAYSADYGHSGTGFWHNREDDVRSARRHLYWRCQGGHRHLLYPNWPPFESATFGHHPTFWRPFPGDCQYCPPVPMTVAPLPPAVPLPADAAVPGPGLRDQVQPEPYAPPPATLPPDSKLELQLDLPTTPPAEVRVPPVGSNLDPRLVQRVDALLRDADAAPIWSAAGTSDAAFALD